MGFFIVHQVCSVGSSGASVALVFSTPVMLPMSTAGQPLMVDIGIGRAECFDFRGEESRMKAIVEKASFTSLVLAVLMGTFCLPSHAQECGDCFDYAIFSCGISVPWDDMSCFDDAYNFCLEDCCRMECEPGTMDCHTRCEDEFIACESDRCLPECEMTCAEDPNHDECMNLCMDDCLMMCWGEEMWCHEDCDLLTEDCVNACVMGIEPDWDGDGISDDFDNCPDVANADQTDGDEDGVGDACDNCPSVPNTDQTDTDGDHAGNPCDLCPTVFSNEPYQDIDGDGIGDACDTDMDADGVENPVDNCPYNDNPGQADADGDGIGDLCDRAALTIAEPTLLDLEIDYMTTLFAPGSRWYEEQTSGFARPFTILPADISNDPYEDIVGWCLPDNTFNDSRIGFYIGDDVYNQPVVSGFKITEPVTTGTILWGIDRASRYAGQYVLNGVTTAFWAGRSYMVEEGLYVFSYNTINFPFLDVQLSAAWDLSTVDGTTRIVGRYMDSTSTWHGFLYSLHYNPDLVESYTAIDYPEAVGTYACGINTAGKIAGYYEDAAHVQHGFIYDGVYRPLDVPGAEWTRAYRINDNGHVAGFYQGSDDRMHGFIYHGVSYTTFDIADARDTLVFGLNDSNKVVGQYRDASGIHPFFAGPIATGGCAGDLDGDDDVDGRDLALLAGDPSMTDLGLFAGDFGKAICQ
jgi:hypothetical protein